MSDPSDLTPFTCAHGSIGEICLVCRAEARVSELGTQLAKARKGANVYYNNSMENKERLQVALSELAALHSPGEITDERIVEIFNEENARFRDSGFDGFLVGAVIRRCLAIDRASRPAPTEPEP